VGRSVGPWTTSCGDLYAILLQPASTRVDALHGSVRQISDSYGICHMSLVNSMVCYDVSIWSISCIIKMSVPHCRELLSMPAHVRLSYTLTEYSSKR
jgi:hypothetical protein